MIVLKFGGSSLGDSRRIGQVVNLIGQYDLQKPLLLVVSALEGVTDRLIEIHREALFRPKTALQNLQRLFREHETVLNALVNSDLLQRVKKEWAQLFQDAQAVLEEPFETPDEAVARRDRLVALGEKLSARIVGAALRTAGFPARWFDADTFLITDERFGHAEADLPATARQLHPLQEALSAGKIPVVTGFIGRTPDGRTTTLGRDGSDYTASILGALLGAVRVEIWTDVDGILTADPEWVEHPSLLPRLSYQETAELAWFGARVLHPKTILPLEQRRIPLLIRNTFNPESPGTLISGKTPETKAGVRSVVCKSNLAEIRIRFRAQRNYSAPLGRLYHLFDDFEEQIFVGPLGATANGLHILINQYRKEKFLQQLQTTFGSEIEKGVLRFEIGAEQQGLITFIGAGLVSRLNLADRVSRTLPAFSRPVSVFSYSNTETHVAFVAPQTHLRDIMNRLHHAFFSETSALHLIVAGPTGQVGRHLLKLLRQAVEENPPTPLRTLQIVGAINRSKMRWNPAGLSWSEVEELNRTSRPADWNRFLQEITDPPVHPLIFIDCTDSSEIARHYLELLRHGVGTITANKIANTLDYSFYQELLRTAREKRVPYSYQTTVGAGTPFIRTIRQLRENGESIHRLEGQLSGTLAYLFHHLNRGESFSRIVRRARAEGITEPHPRVDLQGTDVARKLLILLRESGLEIELNDIVVESLVPPELVSEEDPDIFLEKLSRADAFWNARVAAAHRNGKVLKYLAIYDREGARVKVSELSASEAATWPEGLGNQLRIYTSRFAENPLVIQGPGAGPEFTARGLFGEILEASRQVLHSCPEPLPDSA